LIKWKKSEDELVLKRVIELDNTIKEVLSFIEIYKRELKEFLEKGDYTWSHYQEKLSSYDNKLWEILSVIQKKRRCVKSVIQ
jgi:hypothetical protein